MTGTAVMASKSALDDHFLNLDMDALSSNKPQLEGVARTWAAIIALMFHLSSSRADSPAGDAQDDHARRA
jgi:hypothetical protein